MGEESRFKYVAEVCRTGDWELIREMSRWLVEGLFGDLLQASDSVAMIMEEASEDD